MWALANPREFGLVFANPIADATNVRREMITLSSSGHLFIDHARALAAHHTRSLPSTTCRRGSRGRPGSADPGQYRGIATEDRGLLWVYMEGWNVLYGVVALEVFGHMDPRIIESGEMFVHVLREFAPKLGLADDIGRLEGIIRARFARG